MPNSTYILIQVHDLAGVTALLYVTNQFHTIPNWIKEKKKQRYAANYSKGLRGGSGAWIPRAMRDGPNFCSTWENCGKKKAVGDVSGTCYEGSLRVTQHTKLF